MTSTIWIIVFGRSGEQQVIVRCFSALDAERTIYHNTYYGHRCLKISVKAWS